MQIRVFFDSDTYNTDRLFRNTFDFLQLKFNEFISREGENYFVWIVLAFCGGILIFFHQRDAPTWMDVGIACLVLTSIAICLIAFFQCSIASLVLVSLAFGGLVAKTQLSMLDHPILSEKTEEISLTGMVRYVENFGNDSFRVRLRVDEGWTGPLNSVEAVDVRIWIRDFHFQSHPGDLVRLTVKLFPPPGPKVPGGFDFARRAYFDGLSAVGFAVAPAKSIQPVEPVHSRSSRGYQVQVSRLRQQISERIRTVLPAQSGALIDALMTGNRADLDKDLLAAIRSAGLAHILAISGFHMGLVAGTLFWGVRGVLAALPFLALSVPIRRIAALLALSGAFFYLLISGGSVATQRAFCMLAIVFLGMFFHRPAITHQNVALAAFIILIVSPVQILNIGFQMSFAAVIALVSAYDFYQRRKTRSQNYLEGIPRVLWQTRTFLSAIIMSTLIASLAVAPVAAYHFQTVSHYGLLANILVLPLFTLLMMPMALIVFLAMMGGVEAIPLQVMAFLAELFIWIAREVAHLPYAVSSFPKMSNISFLMFLIGFLVLCILQSRVRFFGILLIGCGIGSLFLNAQPQIFVDGTGKVLVVRSGDGLMSVQAPSPKSYALTSWLRLQGIPEIERQAVSNKSLKCESGNCRFTLGNRTIAYVKQIPKLRAACRSNDILITPFYAPRRCVSKLIIDRNRLQALGGHTLLITHDDISIETVSDYRGAWPWSVRR